MRRLAGISVLIALLVLPWAVWGQQAGTISPGIQPWNVAHVGSVVHVTGVISSHITAFAVANCGTTAAAAVIPHPQQILQRRDIILQNAGNGTIFIGGSHVTVTAASGLGLHSGAVSTSRLVLENFQGRIDCITVGDSQTLNIIEVWR